MHDREEERETENNHSSVGHWSFIFAKGQMYKAGLSMDACLVLLGSKQQALRNVSVAGLPAVSTFLMKTADQHVKWRTKVIFRFERLRQPCQLPTFSVTPTRHSSLLTDWFSAEPVWHCWDSVTQMDLDMWRQRYSNWRKSEMGCFW